MSFEANLNNNSSRKFEKYRYLLHDLESKYRHFKFVNLSICSFGTFEHFCNSFIQMCMDLSIYTGHANYIITKLTSIIICTTCSTFCMRNRRSTTTGPAIVLTVSFFTFSPSCYNYVFVCLIEISVLDAAESKFPSSREISIRMLVYVYENGYAYAFSGRYHKKGLKSGGKRRKFPSIPLS